MPGTESKPRVAPDEGERGAPPAPWRVEGLPEQGEEAGPDRSGTGLLPREPRFWIVLLGLLLLNWFIYNQFAVDRAETRVRVSYTQFRTEVDAGNVREVTSVGSAIEGRFVAPVAPEGKTEAAVRFVTERPSLGDDKVIDVLLDHRDGGDLSPPPARRRRLIRRSGPQGGYARSPRASCRH